MYKHNKHIRLFFAIPYHCMREKNDNYIYDMLKDRNSHLHTYEYPSKEIGKQK